MTFTKEFMIKLQKRLNCSGLYPTTEISVDALLKSKPHYTDKDSTFDAIRKDVLWNCDPLLLKQFWNENINIIDSKLRV
jgi:hypothetical protein